MQRSNSWPLLLGSETDEPPVLFKIDSDLDIAGTEDEDDISTLEITDTDHSVDSRSSVRFNLEQNSQTQDTSFLQRKRASFVTQRHGVYYSLDGEDDDFLPPSVQGQIFNELGQDMKKRLERQCSTATTGTQKSYATVTTNLTTIPEEKERSDKGDKARQWMFQGKVQGSVIFRQYYPEGGWGYVIIFVGLIMTMLTQGFHLSFGVLVKPAIYRFRPSLFSFVSLGAASKALSMFLSPFVIAFCKKKSSRLTAVVGGLIISLGCLFTSFATQFHQLFISYGLFIGVGIAMVQNSFLIMVGQYFKKKRELMEIFIVSGSGGGLFVMSIFLNYTVRKFGWRLGLQAVTITLVSIFFIGMFYRSASLYHPQRRAILHLKNQTRKIKCKKEEKLKLREEKPPLIDFTSLKSRTMQVLIISSSISYPGLISPLLFLSTEAELAGVGSRNIVYLYVYLGLAWILGCCIFGVLVVRNDSDCSISRQYLCQFSLILCGLALLALAHVQDYPGFVLFVSVYGLFLGGHAYSLKMFVFEKVRSKRFPWAWGFIQLFQSIPFIFGAPFSGVVNAKFGAKSNFYLSFLLVMLGSVCMLFIEVHKKKGQRRCRRKDKTVSKEKAEGDIFEEDVDEPINDVNIDYERRNSLPDADDDFLPPLTLLTQQRSVTYGDLVDGNKPDLTCISEEAIADINFPEKFLEELECLENLTSCNKVEKFLGCGDYEEGLYQSGMTRTGLGRKDMTKTALQVVKQRKRTNTCAENSV